MASYTGFFLFGLYRGLWRYTGVEDLLRIAKAVVCSTLLSMAGMVFVYRFDGYSRIVMIVYGFCCSSASRPPACRSACSLR